jgi:hypothetical protein
VRPSAPDRPRPGLLCSRGVTPLSSLLRAHRPIPMPPARTSCFALITSVPTACTIHGWSLGPSRLWFAFLCWSAVPLIPAACRVQLTSSSSTTSAFASLCTARLSASPPQNGFMWATFSIRQAFLNVTALQLASPPDRSAPIAGTRGRFTLELSADSLPPRRSSMLPGRLVNCRGWSFTNKKSSRCRLRHSEGKYWPAAG